MGRGTVGGGLLWPLQHFIRQLQVLLLRRVGPRGEEGLASMVPCEKT